MKKAFFSVLFLTAVLFGGEKVQAQQLKIGVFDIDVMVQVLPGYRGVDSLVQLYDRDSLSAEYDIYMSEYQRLDSTYKTDSALVAQGKKSKALLDYTANERQKMGMNIAYWQNIAQQKEDNKRQQLAQPLYEQVVNAYKKVLDAKKYNLILKPQSVELGGNSVDNLFISVAKELKLTSLPQELLQFGNDPDAPAGGTGGTAPKTNSGGTTTTPKKP
jgi:Skp family chaperone for outer membrane proteins